MFEWRAATWNVQHTCRKDLISITAESSWALTRQWMCQSSVRLMAVMPVSSAVCTPVLACFDAEFMAGSGPSRSLFLLTSICFCD